MPITVTNAHPVNGGDLQDHAEGPPGRSARAATSRKRPTTSSASYDLSISAARADALFASALQRSDEPSARQVQQAVAATIGTYGDLGCAARVAHAYGEYPETAVTRMRWARAAVADSYGGLPNRDPAASTPKWRSTGCSVSHHVAVTGTAGH